MRIIYTVTQINGDYATVLSENGVTNSIAVFLLPENLAEGDKIAFHDFTYTKL